MADRTERTEYYRASVVVTIGAVNQHVDLYALMVAALSQDRYIPQPHYLHVETTVDVTLRINRTGAQEISVTAASGLTIDPAAELDMTHLYFSHTGASSALGDATVTIFAV